MGLGAMDGKIGLVVTNSSIARRTDRPAFLMAETDFGHSFGCDYCADWDNRMFGHVTQVSWSETRGRILIRCPRCGALYENAPEGEDETRRITEDEAISLYPDFR
jgi:hypothetical protein